MVKDVGLNNALAFSPARQNNPELKGSVLRKAPFLIRRSVPVALAGQHLRVEFELQLVEAIASEAGKVHVVSSARKVHCCSGGEIWDSL